MEEKDITNLLERYKQMLVSGKSMYFDADEYDDLAEYYEQLDDIEAARDVVDMGLKIHPNNEYLMQRYAKFLMYDSQYIAALNYLNSNFTSYDFEQYLLKIECLLNLGLYAEAYELTAEVLTDKETDIDVVLSELGFLYLESEYYDEAILYFEKSLEYNAENKDVLSDLVYTYESKNNFESAIRVCNLLLDVDPYSAEAWMMLGRLYSLTGDFEKAIDAFDFVSTIDGDDLNLLKLKAHCLVLAGRINEAIEVLLSCIALSLEEEYLYISLVDCYLSLEDYSKVLEVIGQSENLIGQTSISLAKKGYTYCLLGDVEKSISYINQALAKDDVSPEINIIAGELFSRLDMFAEARAAYEEVLTLRDDDVEVMGKLVSICVNQNNITDAIAFQNKILEMAPTTPNYEKLALLYLENGDRSSFELCVNSFDEASLISLFSIFYSEELVDFANVSREYLLNRLIEAYECRLLYKNMKH